MNWIPPFAAATFAQMILNWSLMTPMPRPEAGGAAALLGDTLVVAGGTTWENGKKVWLRDVQVYDLRAGRWSAGPALPEASAYGPFAQSSAGLEIFGGKDGAAVSRKIWTLDVTLSRWSHSGNAPADLLLGRAARVGNRVFLFGGCADEADLTRCADTVWMREDGGAWRSVAKMPAGAVAMPAAAVWSGKVYLFGGCSMPAAGKLINRSDAWCFDPRDSGWRRLRNLPAANRGAAAASASGRIFLFGGYTASVEEAAGKPPDFGFTAAVWAYDPAADTYTRQAPMPAAMAPGDFFARDGAFWSAGGEDRMRGRSGRTLYAHLASEVK